MVSNTYLSNERKGGKDSLVCKGGGENEAVKAIEASRRMRQGKQR